MIERYKEGKFSFLSLLGKAEAKWIVTNYKSSKEHAKLLNAVKEHLLSFNTLEEDKKNSILSESEQLAENLKNSIREVKLESLTNKDLENINAFFVSQEKKGACPTPNFIEQRFKISQLFANDDKIREEVITKISKAKISAFERRELIRKLKYDTAFSLNMEETPLIYNILIKEIEALASTFSGGKRQSIADKAGHWTIANGLDDGPATDQVALEKLGLDDLRKIHNTFAMYVGIDEDTLKTIEEAVSENPNILDDTQGISPTQVDLFKRHFKIEDDNVAQKCLERFNKEPKDRPLILYAISETQRATASPYSNLSNLSIEECINKVLENPEKEGGKLSDRMIEVFTEDYEARLNWGRDQWNSPASSTQPSTPASPNLTERKIETNPTEEKTHVSTDPVASEQKKPKLTEEQIEKGRRQGEKSPSEVADTFVKFGGVGFRTRLSSFTVGHNTDLDRANSRQSIETAIYNMSNAEKRVFDTLAEGNGLGINASNRYGNRDWSVKNATTENLRKVSDVIKLMGQLKSKGFSAPYSNFLKSMLKNYPKDAEQTLEKYADFVAFTFGTQSLPRISDAIINMNDAAKETFDQFVQEDTGIENASKRCRNQDFLTKLSNENLEKILKVIETMGF